jgi:uncharacterized protein with von Willebrand factor type A (vWA) domain
MRYTYSRWDKTQDVGGVDADELMEILSEDLISDGDVLKALQRVTRWGLQREGPPEGHPEGHPDGTRPTPGLQHLLQRLRSQRQRELERYSLDSMMQSVQDQVAGIVQSEREGIERKLEETSDLDGVREMLETIAQRKRAFLDSLPNDVGPAITALADYEFLDDQARSKFEALIDSLQQQVLQSHFETIRQSLQSMVGDERQDVHDMLHAFNSMLQERIAGREPDFDQFMRRHGHYLPAAGSLDQLVELMQEQAAYTESLLRSMSPAMRQSLEGLVASVLRDEILRQELGQMAELLQTLAPIRHPQPRYPFSGEESLTLSEALRLIRRMHELEQLERSMRQAQDSGDLDSVDGEQVRRLMGDDAHSAIEQLKQLTNVLEEAGYVRRSEDGATSLELTARGIRKIGQRALHDIFRNMKQEAFGKHSTMAPGMGGDRADDSKLYEFGDAFLLDMTRTLMNSVQREGVGSPLTLSVQDFEVFRTEYLTRSSTVLMLDMSRSMPLRGCFVAAKKVAFALNTLIRTQFPRDRLYIIGFSDFARELRPESLHQITWGDYVYGTNMQHGFMMARRLLAKHATANKQIILITDGEPTAHFEGDRVHFSYPPTFRTFQETLREVRRCTQEGIIINTFMLERSHYLADFVNQMTRINRGRAFFATPDRLGDYILVDYVNSKQRAAPAGAHRR